MKNIKVMVVDDSALMRKIITDMINSEPDMMVTDIAKDGENLLSKVSKSIPDVITLDVEMPVMDGITALKELKKLDLNIPVIILSSFSKKSSELTMECLEAGAFDFISKPSGAISLDINKVKDELIQKIRIAVDHKRQKEQAIGYTKSNSANIDKNTDGIKKKVTDRIDAVLIGASTGGPKALYTVITKLPGDLGVPVFVVQHMPAGFTKAFADRLNLNSRLKVVEAADGDAILKNTVYIAPGGYHMEIRNDKRIHLNTEPAIWGVRPAVDKLFISASRVYGPNIVSAVLTGMGKDGAQGTIEVKKAGGITLAEDKSTCVIYGMPKAAFETGMVDAVYPVDSMPEKITGIVLKNRR